MGELIVVGLSNYSWLFACVFIVGWALARLAHYLLNRSTSKTKFAPTKMRSISKKFDFKKRYFKRCITGRNYKKTTSKLNILFFFLSVVSVVLVPAALFVSGVQSWSISPDPMSWGVVGDFFGGTLNPILAFASFIALLYTIRIQSEELRLTREEFAKSVSEQKKISKSNNDSVSVQKDIAVTYENILKLQQDMLDSQKFTQIFNLCATSLQNRNNLIHSLLFEMDESITPHESLYGLFLEALRNVRIIRRVGTEIPEAPFVEVKAEFVRLIEERQSGLFSNNVKRAHRELRLIDLLLGQLVDLDAPNPAFHVLIAGLGMPTAICEMLKDHFDIKDHKWANLTDAFFLGEHIIIRDDLVGTSSS